MDVTDDTDTARAAQLKDIGAAAEAPEAAPAATASEVAAEVRRLRKRLMGWLAPVDGLVHRRGLPAPARLVCDNRLTIAPPTRSPAQRCA